MAVFQALRHSWDFPDSGVFGTTSYSSLTTSDDISALVPGIIINANFCFDGSTYFFTTQDSANYHKIYELNAALDSVVTTYDMSAVDSDIAAVYMIAWSESTSTFWAVCVKAVPETYYLYEFNAALDTVLTKNVASGFATSGNADLTWKDSFIYNFVPNTVFKYSESGVLVDSIDLSPPGAYLFEDYGTAYGMAWDGNLYWHFTLRSEVSTERYIVRVTEDFASIVDAFRIDDLGGNDDPQTITINHTNNLKDNNSRRRRVCLRISTKIKSHD